MDQTIIPQLIYMYIHTYIHTYIEGLLEHIPFAFFAQDKGVDALLECRFSDKILHQNGGRTKKG